jgi:hypothetical protein
VSLIKQIFIICICSLSILNADTNNDYDKIFLALEKQGIILGKDISSQQLFELMQNDNFNELKLEKKIKRLLSFKEEQYKIIHKKINQNPNNKINKEIKIYFDDNNEIIKETQNDIAKADNNGLFSKTINYILELMKI